MRRILLAATLGTLLVTASSASAKPATFKAGTYKAASKGTVEKFKITVKRGNCAAAPGEKKSSLHLCVSLPATPKIECRGAITYENPVASFAPPVQLPASGKLVEKAALTLEAALPGAAPTTGQASFSVIVTKKGTATGSISEALTVPFGAATVSCAGTLTFIAKLG